MRHQIIHEDCITAMREMPESSIHAIVTDPPYGLGFMGQKWDALPPGKDWATECLRVLKPGGFLLAFGGTKTWHRLAVSVEDAGFEIRDSLAWIYSTGFPKHRATLKPAFEPVVMARKPFKGSLVENEAKHGVGALNIDACRTPINAKDAKAIDHMSVKWYGGQEWDMLSGTPRRQPKAHEQGRWPANVLLDESQAAAIDEQSGPSASHGQSFSSGLSRPSIYGHDGRSGVSAEYSDSGGASRFFYVAKASPKERPRVEGVIHPTVKPLKLMRYLIRLVTPEGGTVLDTFAGSGTTIEAALLEGFNTIGIEREAEYLPLIRERIARTEQAQHIGRFYA